MSEKMASANGLCTLAIGHRTARLKLLWMEYKTGDGRNVERARCEDYLSPRGGERIGPNQELLGDALQRQCFWFSVFCSLPLQLVH
jgi:hypothetical protein